jgi:hypothetical protein
VFRRLIAATQFSSIFVIEIFFTARHGFANIIFATGSIAPNWKRRFCQELEYRIFVCVFCAAIYALIPKNVFLFRQKNIFAGPSRLSKKYLCVQQHSTCIPDSFCMYRLHYKLSLDLAFACFCCPTKNRHHFQVGKILFTARLIILEIFRTIIEIVQKSNNRLPRQRYCKV